VKTGSLFSLLREYIFFQGWGFICSGARVHSGGAYYLRFHRIGNSRNFQISEGTYMIPGG